MKKFSKKQITIVAIAIVLLAVIILLAVRSSSTDKPPSENNDDLEDAISLGLKDLNFSTKKEPMKILRYRYIDTSWLVAEVELLDEPEESEAKIMICVLKKTEDDLKLIAFSADGFSENSFPEGTSEDIIKAAEEPWPISTSQSEDI